MINLKLFEEKIFSQNGEDGVTMKLLELIYNGEYDNKFFVEFGVHDGNECNTRILREKYKWGGLQLDGGNENININLRQHFLTKENIINVFNQYNVPKHINLLSVDIDFNDFYCLHEILKEYTCDIIICEYNATHKAHEDKIVMYDANGCWDTSNYFGASLLSLDKLGKMYNYSTVYCNANGVNCFFIHNDIIARNSLEFLHMGEIERIYVPAGYGIGPNGGHPQDPLNRAYLSFEEAINL